jgi:hypothetical protein
MYKFQVCHWQEHSSQTLRGGVLQKNSRGKWEDKKCVHKIFTSPSCDDFLFEFQTQRFQSPSNYLPMYLWKNKTSLQREPRTRVLRKPSNCRVYFVLEFHWSREREREKLRSLILFALDSTARKSRFRSFNSQKFSVPVSSFFLHFCGQRMFSCFLVASSSSLSVV